MPEQQAGDNLSEEVILEENIPEAEEVIIVETFYADL